jgi:FtsH-binding integral membrane protein
MDRNTIAKTVGADLVIVLLSWLVVAWSPPGVPYSVVFGVTLGLVGLVTFFGFYIASSTDPSAPDPRLRTAIAAAFFMFYLVLLTQIFGSPGLRVSFTRAEESAFGRDIFNGFTGFVGVILGFYFTAQAADSVTRTIQSESTIRAAIAADATTAAGVLAARGAASGVTSQVAPPAPPAASQEQGPALRYQPATLP